MSPSPYLQDSDFTLWNGDARSVLSTLPAESVHMAVTSPPFYGLRDYQCDGQIGLESTPEEWVAQLVSVFEEVRRVLRKDGTLWVECGDSYSGSGPSGASYESETTKRRRDLKQDGAFRVSPNLRDRGLGYDRKKPIAVAGTKPKDLLGQPFLLAFALREAGWCWRNCNVWSKPNPMPESVTDRFTVAHSNVLLFSKCTWTGCVEPIYLSERNAAWLAAFVDGEGTISIGATSNGGYQVLLSVCNTNREVLERIVQITGMGSVNESKMGTNRPVYRWEVGSRKAAQILYRIHPHLIIKQRQAWTALALQETHKRYGDNGRPKATTDKQKALLETIRALNRCEEVAVMPPKARWRVNPYFFDAEAVREAFQDPREGGDGFRWNQAKRMPGALQPGGSHATIDGSEGEAPRGHDGRRATAVKQGDNSIQHRDGERWPNSGRNARSVWTIATEPLPFEHYAAFPQALAERCIKAGTSERGCCPECGAPWVRETSVEYIPLGDPAKQNAETRADQRISHRNYDAETNGGPQAMPHGRAEKRTTTTGWHPSCDCWSTGRTGNPRLASIPCTVLDPFLGSGTTALVSRRLGRRCIGVELNEKYAELAAERTQQLSLLGEEVA